MNPAFKTALFNDWRALTDVVGTVAVRVAKKGARGLVLPALRILYCAHDGDAPAGYALDLALLPDCVPSLATRGIFQGRISKLVEQSFRVHTTLSTGAGTLWAGSMTISACFY